MAIRRIYFYADDETDGDVLAWLAAQDNRSQALRALIRAAAGNEAPASAGAAIDEGQLRRVLREELARVAPGLVAAPSIPAAEDDELRVALDDLAATWQFEEVEP